jgi:hypothetical protein
MGGLAGKVYVGVARLGPLILPRQQGDDDDRDHAQREAE